MDTIAKRQKSLYQQFNFICQCEACLEDKYAGFIMSDGEEFKVKGDSKMNMEEYKINCSYIIENIQNFPTVNLISAMIKNGNILAHEANNIYL